MWLLDITAEVKSTFSFKIKSLMFTDFFEVALTGCFNHMLYCYCQASVVHLLSYNPVVLAKGWCWILCWELPFHFIFWQPVYLRCLVIPWNILFKILYAFCNQIDLTLESQKCITIICKDLVCTCRKVPVSHYRDQLVNAVCGNKHHSHSPVQVHYFLLSLSNFLPISLHFSLIEHYFSIFCFPLPTFFHPLPLIFPPMQKACHNTLQNPHSF